MNRRPSLAGGFTLVEIVIALLISSLVVLGTYTVYSRVLALMEQCERLVQHKREERLLCSVLHDDLESIIYLEKSGQAEIDLMYLLAREPSKTFQADATGDMELISFATSSLLAVGAPFPSLAFARVQYVLRPADKQAGLTARLVRRELAWANLEWDGAQKMPWQETVLATDVDSLELTFVPEASAADDPSAVSQAVTSWDSRQRLLQGLSPLPRLVRAAVTYHRPEGTRRTEVAVVLPDRLLRVEWP